MRIDPEFKLRLPLGFVRGLLVGAVACGSAGIFFFSQPAPEERITRLHDLAESKGDVASVCLKKRLDENRQPSRWEYLGMMECFKT